jgi:transcriptional regulator with XRE-family HTH domain
MAKSTPTADALTLVGRDVGNTVRRLRADRTQAEIARRAGVSQSMLSRIERGLDDVALTPLLLFRLACALNCAPSELLAAYDAHFEQAKREGLAS